MSESMKRKRGGIRQRVERAEESMQPTIGSCLYTFLLAKFAWGEFSPQMVRQIAALALDDFAKAKESNGRLIELENLAKLGTAGKHSNNCHRDLMKAVQGTSQLPAALVVQLPFSGKYGLQTQSVLVPHEMFAVIYNEYPNSWRKIMVPDSDKLNDFWTAMETHPNMLGHPNQTRFDYKTKCIPLALHGDEVPVTGRGKCWCKSMLTFQWLSLVGLGGTADRMLWIWSVIEKYCSAGQNGTLDVYWRIISWSLYWLWRGLWPSQNWNGQQHLVSFGEICVILFFKFVRFVNTICSVKVRSRIAAGYQGLDPIGWWLLWVCVGGYGGFGLLFENPWSSSLYQP